MNESVSATLTLFLMNLFFIIGFLPHMIEQGGGTVVAVSSLQGRIGLPERSACMYKQTASNFFVRFCHSRLLGW